MRIINFSAQMKHKTHRMLSYAEQEERLKDFLGKFQDVDVGDLGPDYEMWGHKKYMINMQQISNEETGIFSVLIEDLESYFHREEEKSMLAGFRSNTSRYIKMVSGVVSRLLPKRTSPIKPDEQIRHRYENILADQRRDNFSQIPGDSEQAEQIPYQINQNFDVTIKFGPAAKRPVKSIGQLSADDLGGLVTIKAIVLRASEVKPEIVMAVYACDICGCQNYVYLPDRTFRHLNSCQSTKCQGNKVSGKLTFMPGHSTFRSFQEIKIQETPDQMGPGTIPKTMRVELRGNLVKTASPGDMILLQGVYLPYKERLNCITHKDKMYELSFNDSIHAVEVIREKKKYVQMALTEDIRAEIEKVRANTQQNFLFDKLARSIAPQIYGMDDVKKSLLMMMAGGITIETHDRMRIRGEINIALIGDPGIAKSQLLKHISRLAPRGVYTTGKGSSGVGLTAAIVTDPLTKELSLEAGALVLADMGVCCIDEFDKMDEYDRTAIHEVMEQQTVSIAKAGISSTLNARTSILAAANPLYGRYNKRETPHKNINMPAALLSRFDLVYILIDRVDQKEDRQLSRFIGRVHQKGKPPMTRDAFSSQFLRSYIALSKNYQPTLSEELHKDLIEKYIEKRNSEAGSMREGESYTTPRTLLALIRLCQARARLRFSNEVAKSDVLECIETLEYCQRAVIEDHEGRKPIVDDISQIYQMIKDMCKYNHGNQCLLSAIKTRTLFKNWTEKDLQTTLTHYGNLDVLMVRGDTVYLIEDGQ